MQSYQELKVWQRGMELVEDVYRIARKLPAEERFGLSSQMCRAVVSIVSNIAEGYKRRALGNYVRFLCIADGSAAELETQLIVVHRLYPTIDTARALSLNEEVQKMLHSLIQKLSDSRKAIA